MRIEETGDHRVHLLFLHDHHPMTAVAEQHGLRSRSILDSLSWCEGGTMALWTPLIHSAGGGGNIVLVNLNAQNASGRRTVPPSIMVNRRVGIPVSSH